MRGEFIGVWSEMWWDIWTPLIEEPYNEKDEYIPEDIFCELYRNLAKALIMPTGDEAVILLLEDPVILKEVFVISAKMADQNFSFEEIDEAFFNSGATELTKADERKKAIETTLTTKLGLPSSFQIDVQLNEFAHDHLKIEDASQRKLERIINDKKKGREAFENTRTKDLIGERAVVGFLESVHYILEEFGGDGVSNCYFNLLTAFIEKFSLRYELRRPCILCPSLSGVFSSLIRDLRALTTQDNHLDMLMKDFDESVRDLRIDCTERRIKTCIQKQINLLEALGWEALDRTDPEIRRKALSSFAQQIASWPHEDVLSALKSIYGFTCDYPGIRHAGTPSHALRAIDMRDMVAISILLIGFTPYLCPQINAETVYQRG